MADKGPDLNSLRALHARLLSDHALQFDFTGASAPRLPHLPAWLVALEKAMGKAIGEALPVLKYIFIAGVVVALCVVLFLIARELFGARFAGRRRAPRAAPADWRPEPWKARALLEDADRLAALGRFDEAARLILHRGVEDIEGRRPRLVKPALTARDIAALEDLPTAARQAFGEIVGIVEQSLFAGRPLGAETFAACRRAYQAFALPPAWA